MLGKKKTVGGGWGWGKRRRKVCFMILQLRERKVTSLMKIPRRHI